MRLVACMGAAFLAAGVAHADRHPVSTTPIPVGPAFTPETIDGLKDKATKLLFWSQAERDANFAHMDRIFPAHVIRASRRSRPLLAGRPLPIAPAEVDAYMRDGYLAGLIVLDHGRVRLERYARDLTPGGHWASFSVAKSFTSTLVGAAIRDGYIAGLSDPVIRYIPELRGSAYDGVTVEQVLTMTSGVRWNEDYTDPNSDVVRSAAVKPAPGQDPTVAYLSTLPREAAPGTKWVYKTGEANLIGVLVSRATHLPLANYAAARIAGPAGFEQNGSWAIGETGQEVGGCCINLSLRDYARMGQFAIDGGDGQVPAGWFDQAMAAQHTVEKGKLGYGYQWWIYPKGAAAEGIYGQDIFVDRKNQIVVVTLAAWPKATDPKLGTMTDEFNDRVIDAIMHERHGTNGF